MQPQENPARVLLGLHGDSTEGFLLKNQYCLECMSAALDTIDANILIDTLHNRLGVKGTPLKWFRSYLSDRCFAVKVANSQSTDHKLKYGVPQGSVHGPFLFTVYSAATEAIPKKHAIKYHKYADDIQIYFFPQTTCAG